MRKKRPITERLSRYTTYRVRSAELGIRKFFCRLGKVTPASKLVLFILGFQRSGTTMLVDTLNKSMDIDTYGEENRQAFDESWRLRGKEATSPLIAQSSAKCVVFKPVCDSHLAIDLLNDYGNSKSVWIYRNYQDAVNSAVVNWGDQAVKVIHDTLAGRMIWGWRQEGISQETLTRMKQVWRSDLSSHEAFALFWYQRNQLFFELGLDKNPQIFCVHYENLVTNPEYTFAKIFEFIELPFPKNIISGVFATSVSKRQFPGAHQTITAMCEDLLERLDNVAHV